MVEFDLQRRALGDLWVSIGIAVSMAIYHLSTTVLGRWIEISDDWLFLVHNALFAWILSLLWVAYRRWRVALRRQSDLRRILGSIATEVILVVDRRRRIRMVNDSVTAVFGRTAAELLGQTTEMLYHDRRTPDGASIREEMDRIGFHVGRAVAIRSDGTEFEIEITTSLLRGHEGAVVMIKDITARRRAEEAILAAKVAAERASEERGVLIDELRQNFDRLKELETLRDSLTHMIVHDMRSPIQVMLTQLELVLNYPEGPVAPADRIRLEDAKARAGWLVNMTRSMLDVSRMEAHEFPLSLAPCEVMALVADSVQSCRPLAEGVKLTGPSGPPLEGRMDREVIGRVIVNLLVNAIKYSPSGCAVTVGVARTAAGRIRIEVSDQGPGVAPGDRERIFEKFAQAAAVARRQAHHSVGLGLAFCKLAVEAHGGTIGVHSESTGGSTFWLELPADEPAPATTGS